MKRQIVLGSLVCLAVMVVLLLCWNWLPERIPVEYNAGEMCRRLCRNRRWCLECRFYVAC